MAAKNHKEGRKRFCLRDNERCGNHDYFHYFVGLLRSLVGCMVLFSEKS